MESYENLLERAQSKIPKGVLSKERFEIPKVQGLVEGSKTIVTNFLQIASMFHREPQHLLKYLLRELASPGSIDGQRLILGKKVNSSIINDKIERYANDFVICKDCKKPDTQLIREERILIMKCTACGAKHPISSKI